MNISDFEKINKTIINNVKDLLMQYPKARNNNMYLILMYWRKFDKPDFKKSISELANTLTNAESITRARRALRYEFPLSEAKRELEVKYRKFYGGARI